AGDDLLRGQALRDGDLMLDHLPFDQSVDDVVQACLPAKHVLAVFELVTRLERDHPAHEHPGLVDDALALQELGDVLDAEPARDVDDAVAIEGTGRFEALLAGSKRKAADDGHQHEDRQNGVADDDDGMAGTAGASERLENAFGLERSARTARGDTRSATIPGLLGRVRHPAQQRRSLLVPRVPARGLDASTFMYHFSA